MRRVKHIARTYHVIAVVVLAAFVFGAAIGIAGTVVINPPEHTHVMWNGQTIHGEMSKK